MSTGLTQSDINALQGYLDNGDRYGYWNYLASRGDQYAQLALHVVTNEHFSGYLANEYAKAYGEENYGITLSSSEWWEFGVELAQADLTGRINLLNDGEITAEQALHLSSTVYGFKLIEEYHQDLGTT